MALWVALSIGASPVGFARADALDTVAAAGRFDTIVIDAGHGGRDEGARGRDGLIEKTVVLDVAHRLRDRLVGFGYRVVLTREADDRVSLR
ncbi:MAG: N-acetylmuramoyl-L-alanine amidase, partial [Deltaproteobacteria bacterium]|nr:N-acetylmuramoyl-L-alanine amidase [Deltaproteobacteria bacterium]